MLESRFVKTSAIIADTANIAFSTKNGPRGAIADTICIAFRAKKNKHKEKS
jgi:hypothetical protein